MATTKKKNKHMIASLDQIAFLNYIGYTLENFLTLPLENSMIYLNLVVRTARQEVPWSDWKTHTIFFQMFGDRITCLSLKNIEWAEYSIEHSMESDFSFSTEDYFLQFQAFAPSFDHDSSEDKTTTTDLVFATVRNLRL
jgi:hypothetical protein